MIADCTQHYEGNSRSDLSTCKSIDSVPASAYICSGSCSLQFVGNQGDNSPLSDPDNKTTIFYCVTFRLRAADAAVQR